MVPAKQQVNGENALATYRMQLYALVLFAYGLVLKVLLMVSVALFDCHGVGRFWMGSGLFWGFVVVFGLMTLLALVPSLRPREYRAEGSPGHRWSLVATGFSLYVASWLVLLFAFLRPETLVGRMLASSLGFDSGNWCS